MKQGVGVGQTSAPRCSGGFAPLFHFSLVFYLLPPARKYYNHNHLVKGR